MKQQDQDIQELLNMTAAQRTELQYLWAEDDMSRTESVQNGLTPPNQWLWLMLYLVFRVYHTFRYVSTLEALDDTITSAYIQAQEWARKRNNRWLSRVFLFRQRLAGLIAATMSWQAHMLDATRDGKDIGLDAIRDGKDIGLGQTGSNRNGTGRARMSKETITILPASLASVDDWEKPKSVRKRTRC